MKTKIIIALLTLTFASTGYPVPINILDTQYTTTLGDFTSPPYPATNYSRTQSSAAPISDTLYDSHGDSEASANAGLFGVSEVTSSSPYNISFEGVQSSYAFVESDLWFSPLTSQTTTMNIQISLNTLQFHYQQGAVNLLDVTTGNEVWSYGNGTFPSGITYGTALDPSDFTEGIQGTDTLMIDTDLNASDTYELSLLAGSNSSDDFENESIQLLSGLEPVPEPSTVALIGLGSLAMVMVRRSYSSSAVS